jgi:nitrite reductase/ring-hydroxylating ferredoxin subunit
MAKFVQFAKKSQVPENGVIAVQVEGRSLALINLHGEIYALDDNCPHEGGPLSDGQVVGDEIECPWHASRRTGSVPR